MTAYPPTTIFFWQRILLLAVALPVLIVGASKIFGLAEKMLDSGFIAAMASLGYALGIAMLYRTRWGWRFVLSQQNVFVLLSVNIFGRSTIAVYVDNQKIKKKKSLREAVNFIEFKLDGREYSVRVEKKFSSGAVQCGVSVDGVGLVTDT